MKAAMHGVAGPGLLLPNMSTCNPTWCRGFEWLEQKSVRARVHEGVQSAACVGLWFVRLCGCGHGSRRGRGGRAGTCVCTGALVQVPARVRAVRQVGGRGGGNVCMPKSGTHIMSSSRVLHIPRQEISRKFAKCSLNKCHGLANNSCKLAS